MLLAKEKGGEAYSTCWNYHYYHTASIVLAELIKISSDANTSRGRPTNIPPEVHLLLMNDGIRIKSSFYCFNPTAD